MGAALEVEELVKRYGAQAALDGVTLHVTGGEFFTLLGPSGCGKTTLLRCVAGFARPDGGRVVCDGARLDALPAHARDIGMVFQNYAIFPHLSVAENVAYGLQARRRGREEIARRVDEALALVELGALARRMPTQLSGGQQQRVALARALVIRPRLLLMDEPLSNLDARLRVAMRGEIRRIQRELGITTVYVTHDQEEALAVSDRLAVMQDGRVEQIGTPWEIYARPRTAFAARFVGLSNAVEVRVRARSGRQVTVDAPGFSLRGETDLADARLLAVFRPEAVRLLPPGPDPPETGAGDGRIVSREFLGAVLRCAIRTADGTSIVADLHKPAAADTAGDARPVRFAVAAEDVRFFPVAAGR